MKVGKLMELQSPCRANLIDGKYNMNKNPFIHGVDFWGNHLAKDIFVDGFCWLDCIFVVDFNDLFSVVTPI